MSGQQTAPDSTELAGEYDPGEVEPRWQQRWLDDDTYAYRGGPELDPDAVYAIDTPPPTVSGSLHMGHLYGHTLQDFAARFHRMAGEATFFPFGYDDNGIASERLTERELGIRHQEYSRREFQQRTREVCREYEADFTEEMQSLATSIDWSKTYKTIEPRVQRVSQLSFVDLYDRGREYRKKAPAIWCPDCETAISQVEREDAERDAHFHDVAFRLEGSDDEFVISTTRPELLPACVAVFVHPEDDENRDLVGRTAEIPIFGQAVPILEDERVDRETGTGVVMCCTFGDGTDIEWYEAHDLPLRVAIDESGTMTDLAGEYAGLSTADAREAIADNLDEAGALRDRRAITHTVQVHERCESDLEFLVTEQWYVKLLDRMEAYLDAGREMDWYPDKMLTRYEHWVEGLEWDWLISRQRDSGIPFPVWYCAECRETVVADREALPVDPIADDPPVDACPECGHDAFEPEEDVFDTWATSSLTPLINAGWDWNAEAGAFEMANPELYPFDVRPQGHDIISFWLFHTVVKCLEHTGEVPFDGVMINGWVLDENREKMSKSKGNVIVPAEIMDEYPVDAIRYWAASSAVGDDFPFKDNEMRMGEKLLQKLWNASKLVDDLTPDEPLDEPDDLAPIDRWLLATVDDLVADATDHLYDYEFSKARDRTRTVFWNTFCDDYLEIAKGRVRDAPGATGGADSSANRGNGADAAVGDPSAAYTLQRAHRTLLKLFAPILPHVTEEIWRTVYDGGSIHTTEWPEPAGYDADREAGGTAMAVISALRTYKSKRQLPMNEPLDRVRVFGDVGEFADAIAGVMHVADLVVHEERPETETTITSVDLDYATLGPKYGETVQDFDAAIEAGEFAVEDGELVVAGERLAPGTFAVERETTYAGDGELLEADDAVVVVE